VKSKASATQMTRTSVAVTPTQTVYLAGW
jgi:hypothetical protein